MELVKTKGLRRYLYLSMKLDEEEQTEARWGAAKSETMVQQVQTPVTVYRSFPLIGQRMDEFGLNLISSLVSVMPATEMKKGKISSKSAVDTNQDAKHKG